MPECPRRAYPPSRRFPGALDSGALIICDHASNAIPPGYGALGLEREALDRHIAYDIGAADVTRALAGLLGAPAVLSTYSRLVIDPNRGLDDPTLVMRYSDGAIVPGNAYADQAEIDRRSARFWTPYRQEIAATIDAMMATGEPPALISIHSFTDVWRGFSRPWKIGLLWDRDDRIAKPLIEALLAEPDLDADDVGDNEPYDGALAGDTIDAAATSRGLANVLIEIRQDLIGEKNERAGMGPAHRPPAQARPRRSAVARARRFWHARAAGSSWPGKTLRRNLTRTDVRGDPSPSTKRSRDHGMNMAKAPDTNATEVGEVNAGHLRAFIERIERLEEEKKALASDIKDVYGEAKANGFDVKIMRKIVSIRKQDRDSRLEEETVLDLYLAALGMN